jgi:hypothetical protein
MTTAGSFVGWYYKREGQRFGPLSTTQLRQLLASGHLRSADCVWQKWARGGDCIKVVTVQAASDGEGPSDRPRVQIL